MLQKEERAPAGPFSCLPNQALGRERCAAPATRFRLGIDEGDAPRQPLRDVVEGGAVEVEIALGVAHDLYPVDVELLVVRPRFVVELERVREARATAPLDP